MKLYSANNVWRADLSSPPSPAPHSTADVFSSYPFSQGCETSNTHAHCLHSRSVTSDLKLCFYCWKYSVWINGRGPDCAAGLLWELPWSIFSINNCSGKEIKSPTMFKPREILCLIQGNRKFHLAFLISTLPMNTALICYFICGGELHLGHVRSTFTCISHDPTLLHDDIILFLNGIFLIETNSSILYVVSPPISSKQGFWCSIYCITHFPASTMHVASCITIKCNNRL